MALALPINKPGASNNKSRLHNFGWFLGGVLALFLILKIQSGGATPHRFLSQHFESDPADTSPHESLSEPEPEAELQAKPKSVEHTDKKSKEKSTSISKVPAWNEFEQLFIFGDSYTSIWFQPKGKQPSRTNPYGNRHYNNPPVWVQYLTETHNASFLRTYDFAVGGSTVDRALAKPFLMGTTFKEQVRQKFIPLYTGKKPQAKWNPRKTLFMGWFGVNDIFGTNNPPIAKILKSYEKSAEELYSHGARHMIYFTVPPFERSSDKSMEIKTKVAAEVTAFNSRIYEMRENLQQKYPDLDIAIFDAFHFWIRLMDGPRDFEETKTVKYTTRVCRKPRMRFPEDEPLTAKCATGVVANYLWYGIHGTYTTHNATAKRLVTDCFAPNGRTGYCS